jgi:hypothetical protein
MSNQGGGLEQMGNFLHANSLMSEYRFFIERYESLSVIESHAKCLPIISSLCSALGANVEAMKAITRMFTASHIDFDRALFCSWFCLVQARKLGLNEKHQQALFNAGLLQDIGKYVVDDSVAQFIRNMPGAKVLPLGRHELSDSHPLLSSCFIEKHFPDDTVLRELVLHHHANADGSGYPSGVVESQIGLDDQLLIVANQLCDRIDILGCYSDIDQSLPYIKLASLLYFQRVHVSCFRLLNDALMSSKKPLCYSSNEAKSMLSKNVERAAELRNCVDSLVALSGDLIRYDFDVVVRGIRSNIERFVFVANETGILWEGAFSPDSNISDAELSEVEGVFHALPESLTRFKRYLPQLANKSQYGLSLERTNRVIANVDNCLKKLTTRRQFTL